MRKPTKAEIEKQKVHRALDKEKKVEPIPDPVETPRETHEETQEERRKRWDNVWGANFSDNDCLILEGARPDP